MRELQRAIEIDASPGVVWDVLVDFERYPDWNPLIRHVSGRLRAGGKLAVRAKLPGGLPVRFKPTVLAVEPEHELSWIACMLMSRLFEGVHRFVLEEIGKGRCRFVQVEYFSGSLARISGGLLAQNALGYEYMNVALKQRAECLTPPEALEPKV